MSALGQLTERTYVLKREFQSREVIAKVFNNKRQFSYSFRIRILLFLSHLLWLTVLLIFFLPDFLIQPNFFARLCETLVSFILFV